MWQLRGHGHTHNGNSHWIRSIEPTQFINFSQIIRWFIALNVAGKVFQFFGISNSKKKKMVRHRVFASKEN